jgi:hypothetical protein
MTLVEARTPRGSDVHIRAPSAPIEEGRHGCGLCIQPRASNRPMGAKTRDLFAILVLFGGVGALS